MNELRQWRRTVSDVYAQIAAEVTEMTGTPFEGSQCQWIAEQAQERLRKAAGIAGDLDHARRRTQLHVASKGDAL